MSQLSVGDLANAFQLRRFTAGSKQDLTRLANELSSGRKSDIGAAVSGDFGPFAGIERALRAVEAYKTTNAEAETFFASAQLALDNVQAKTKSLSPALLTASSARDATLIRATAVDAKQDFEAIVSSFNTRIADRALFAGAAIDRNALAPASEILDDLKSATLGLTTAADLEAAVIAWFDAPGGGFETLGYTGAQSDMGAMSIADRDAVTMTARADDRVVRDTLKGVAMAALIAEGALASDVAQQAELTERASGHVLRANTNLIALQAEVGTVQERIEDAQAQNAAEASAYEIARNELIAADPYETATDLQAVYAQIETLYTITARISALRFTDYM